jgi:hypothetical protein
LTLEATGSATQQSIGGHGQKTWEVD